MSADEGQFYFVGGMYVEGRTTWPDSCHLWLDQDVVRLGVFVPYPTPGEIAAIGAGRARFAWTEKRFTGYLLLKYGQQPWTYASFNPQRLSEPFDLVPEPRGTHIQMATFLVGSHNGRIYAMRAFTWPAYFFNTVVASIHRLAATPYSEEAALAEKDQIDAEYPDGPALYRLQQGLDRMAKCEGGQRDDKPLAK